MTALPIPNLNLNVATPSSAGSNSGSGTVTFGDFKSGLSLPFLVLIAATGFIAWKIVKSV